jgi:hypothetical protein
MEAYNKEFSLTNRPRLIALPPKGSNALNVAALNSHNNINNNNNNSVNQGIIITKTNASDNSSSKISFDSAAN